MYFITHITDKTRKSKHTRLRNWNIVVYYCLILYKLRSYSLILNDDDDDDVVEVNRNICCGGIAENDCGIFASLT